MHKGDFAVRVYQAFGTDEYGWNTNREGYRVGHALHSSRGAAEEDTDKSLAAAGHVCDDGCYRWRSLT